MKQPALAPLLAEASLPPTLHTNFDAVNSGVQLQVRLRARARPPPPNPHTTPLLQMRAPGSTNWTA